jgi:hypothetical protein
LKLVLYIYKSLFPVPKNDSEVERLGSEPGTHGPLPDTLIDHRDGLRHQASDGDPLLLALDPMAGEIEAQGLGFDSRVARRVEYHDYATQFIVSHGLIRIAILTSFHYMNII